MSGDEETRWSRFPLSIWRSRLRAARLMSVDDCGGVTIRRPHDGAITIFPRETAEEDAATATLGEGLRELPALRVNQDRQVAGPLV